MEHSVCFIGHRKINDTPELRERLQIILQELIDTGTTNFIFGDHSAFDDLCYELVTELKEKYPAIKRINFRKDYEDTNDYIFNFIFIPSTINNDILKNYSVQKKVSLLNQADTMNQIKCEYSKMILEIIGDKFRDPIDVQHLDDKEKEELDKYWLVTFKREYARYTADIIDKIIERFKITE